MAETVRDWPIQDDPDPEPSRTRSRAVGLWILGLSLMAVGLTLLVVYGGSVRWQSIAGMSALVVGCVPIIVASFVQAELRSWMEQ